MPVLGTVRNPLIDLGRARRQNDTAEVGYYRSFLDGGIDVELAGSPHAGMYQYSFPDGENSVVVDVSHVLPSFRGLGWGQGYAGGSFELTKSGYTGHGIYNNGWNLAPNWSIYFCGHFDQSPTGQQIFTSVDAGGSNTSLYTYGTLSSTNGTHRQGGVFTFDDNKVISRVGISFISTEKACYNVQSEIPKDTTLQSLVEKAQAKWNGDIFSKVTTTEKDETVLRQLYSYLYGMSEFMTSILNLQANANVDRSYTLKPHRRESTVGVRRALL